MSRKFWISAVAIGLTTASAVTLADDRYDNTYRERYDDSGYEYARVVV